jgi:hypothetical protein
MDRLAAMGMAQTAHASGAQLICDAWHPVVPQHYLLIAAHAHIEFQGIGTQLEGCLEARKGIFARLMRRTPMPDNQEVVPWRLRSHGKSRLSTRHC